MRSSRKWRKRGRGSEHSVVEGWGLRVWGLGVQGSGYTIEVSGLRVRDQGFGIKGSGLMGQE
jgi:hypothetical protein